VSAMGVRTASRRNEAGRSSRSSATVRSAGVYLTSTTAAAAAGGTSRGRAAYGFEGRNRGTTGVLLAAPLAVGRADKEGSGMVTPKCSAMATGCMRGSKLPHHDAAGERFL